MYDVFLLSSTDGRIYYANRARGLISGVPKENIILNELRTTVTSKVQKYIL